MNWIKQWWFDRNWLRQKVNKALLPTNYINIALRLKNQKTIRMNTRKNERKRRWNWNCTLEDISEALGKILMTGKGGCTTACLLSSSHRPIEAPALIVVGCVEVLPGQIQQIHKLVLSTTSYTRAISKRNRLRQNFTLNSMYDAFLSSHCLSITMNATQ